MSVELTENRPRPIEQAETRAGRFKNKNKRKAKTKTQFNGEAG